MNLDNIKKACKLIENSNKTMVLTGAGISTESGIPDFRSPGTGLWENTDPMEVLSTTVLRNNPERFYKDGFNILLDMMDARPNKAHNILAEMEGLGLIHGVITQNIDNLHQKAGSKYILEVHGNTRKGSCINCGDTVNIRILTEKVNNGEIPPKCNKCGGILRPDVILFGDMLPSAFNVALKEVETSDLLIVIGSSLMVSPVNYLPQMARKLIIINMGYTPMDNFAEVKIEEKAGDALEAILNLLERA